MTKSPQVTVSEKENQITFGVKCLNQSLRDYWNKNLAKYGPKIKISSDLLETL